MCSMGSNNDALVGLVGTLLGVFVGWFLNVISYKIGKIAIRAKLEPTIDIPASSPDAKNQTEVGWEYIIECKATNSKQVPTLLSDFKVEIQNKRFAKKKTVTVFSAEKQVANINGLRVLINTALEPQLIPARDLLVFKLKVNYSNEDIQWSKVRLIAYDERNRKQKFILYNNWKYEKAFDELNKIKEKQVKP